MIKYLNIIIRFLVVDTDFGYQEGNMKVSNGPKEGKHKMPKERLSCIIYGFLNVI